MKKLYPLLFFILLPIISVAQGEAAWWFFGENAAVDFNNGAPESNITGSLNTLEGCSSISDSCGNLLFYSDGSTVWNNTGAIMDNGTGLEGNSSAAQSGIIVPDLVTTNLYYIFTVPNAGGPVKYSIIDITSNGGLGRVLRKNIPITGPGTTPPSSHEKVTAVLHADGNKFWVMTYSNGQYRAYIAAAGGIQTGSEVISNIPSSLTDNRGSLKFSPDGTKVANTSVGDGAVIADFDSSTGIVSNQRNLNLGYTSAYGVEFSPESNVLYVDANTSSGGNTCTGGTRAVVMFDTTVPNGHTNPTTLFTENNESRGALQLGIDQKVYVARSCQQFIGAISNPNDISTATYDRTALRLRNGSRCREGLPPFITTFFNPAFFVNGVDPTNPSFTSNLDLCENATINFESVNSDYCLNPAPTFLWDFGDGNTSSLENPSHTYTAEGTYTVTFSVTNFNFTKTVEGVVNVRETSFIANTVGDVFVFDSNNDGSEPKDLSINESPLILGSQDPNVFEVTYHLSQSEAVSNTNAQAQPQVFQLGRTPVWARVTNVNLPADSQCFETTSFDVIVSPFTGAQQPDDLTICDNNNDGFNEFNLTQTINQVTGGAGSLFDVTFFETQAEAQPGSGASPIPNPANYDNQIAYSDRVYIRMEDTQTPPQPTTTTFVDLIVADTPTSNPVMNMRFCDVNNDGTEPIDLAAEFNNQVLNGQNNPDYRVTYHLTQLQADDDVDQLSSPYDLTTTTTIYVRIDNDTQNECADTSQSFTLFLDTVPTANTVAPFRLCDDPSNNGAESFDLFSRNNEVLGSNQSSTDFDIEYFTSQSDADLGSLNGATPLVQNYSSAGQTVYARIENVLNRDCYDTTSFDLIVDERPEAFAPTSNLEFCDDISSINLGDYVGEVLGSQVNPDFEVTFYDNQNNANAGTSDLGSSFDPAIGVNTLFARIDNTVSDCPPSIVSFEVMRSEIPAGISEVNYRLCDTDDDGQEVFILDSRNAQILNGQDENQFTVEYYATETDARSGAGSPLPNNYSLDLATGSTTVFARIENVDNRNCTADPIAVNLFVDEIPEIRPIATVQDCDDDGVKDVDLSSYNSQILDDPNNTNFDVSYHANQNDADTGDRPLSTPYQITPSTPTIYARAFNVNDPQGCAVTTSFNIEISQRPVANTVQDYVECDDLDNNLEKEIDLTQFYTEVLGDQNPADYDISFYASSDDAQNSNDSLPVMYNVGENGNPETIFVRIEAVSFSDCAAFTDFEITITSQPKAYTAPDLTSCDNEPFDQSESFNLGDQDSAILFGQDNQLFNVSYHASQNDADTGANPLPKQDYFNTSPNQIIYARIENAIYPDLCPDFSEFTLSVFDRPEIRDQGPIVICAGVPETIDAGPGYASYLWSTGEITRTIDVTEGGEYTVTVTNDNNCDSTATIRVKESDIATITEVIVEQFEVKRNKIKVIAEGPGSYIYSLDDFVYQDEPLFEDMRPGFYEVFVKDENGCGTVSEEVVIIGGPAFFTPNQDGYNDTWQIIAGETVPDARVSIFDRYGKLITSIEAGSQGWDGTFNGTPLPSTDYWYTVELDDGRSFKGHFALKR